MCILINKSPKNKFLRMAFTNLLINTLEMFTTVSKIKSVIGPFDIMANYTRVHSINRGQFKRALLKRNNRFYLILLDDR